MSYKHSLADVIACAWWPNDGPVKLAPPATPYSYDEDVVDVPKVDGRAPGAGGHRNTPAVVLLMLESAGSDGLTVREVGERLVLGNHAASAVLNKLRHAGKVVRKGPSGHPDSRWLLADVVMERAA